MTLRNCTQATLLQTLIASRPGDIVVAAGPISIKGLGGLNFAGAGVKLRAAPGATLSGWSDSPFAGLTFSGFKINCAHPGVSELGLWATKGGSLAIEDCQFVGPGADPEAGAGSGLVMMGCVKTRRCTFSKIYAGISIQGGKGHLVEDCQFRDLWQDAISGNPGGDTTIRRNYFTDFRGPSVHLDCIQLITTKEPNDGILIEGNVYERGTGTAAQGVFTDKASGAWIIRGNAFLGGPWQTIAIYGAVEGTVIEDNFLQGFEEVNPDKKVMTPWIKVQNSMAKVVIRNNVTTGFNNVNSPNLQLSGNTTIQNAKPGDRSALVEWMKGRDVAAAAKKVAAMGGSPLAEAAAVLALGGAALHGEASRRGVLGLLLAQGAGLFGRR